MTQDLAGKAALVTGASRGLGRALAEMIGARGAEVVALARTTGGLEELDDAIRAAGGPSATLAPLDITDDAGVERLGAAIHQRWGRLDLLVHCAVHATPLSPCEHVSARDYDRAHAVNARATWQLIRCMDPLLRAAGGRAAFFDDPHDTGAFHGAYAASKAAARALTSAWAEETRNMPVQVVHLAPPPMPTAVRARFHPGEDKSALTSPRDAAEALLPDLLGA